MGSEVEDALDVVALVLEVCVVLFLFGACFGSQPRQAIAMMKISEGSERKFFICLAYIAVLC